MFWKVYKIGYVKYNSPFKLNEHQDIYMSSLEQNAVSQYRRDCFPMWTKQKHFGFLIFKDNLFDQNQLANNMSSMLMDSIRTLNDLLDDETFVPLANCMKWSNVHEFWRSLLHIIKITNGKGLNPVALRNEAIQIEKVFDCIIINRGLPIVVCYRYSF